MNSYPIITIGRKVDFSKWKIGIWTGLFCLAGALCSSGAEAETKEEPVVELPKYVVTANRTPVDIVNVSQTVDVVSSRDVEMSRASFGTDILKKTASVDVIQYPGGTSGVSLRGFRPEYSNETNPRTLLLIDGRPVSSSLGNIPTYNIERIEILKGPASAIYGPSAMGGVINIITKRSNGEFQGSAFVQYGSYKTADAGFNIGGNLTEKFSLDLSLDWIDRGKDYSFGEGDDYEVGEGGGTVYKNTKFSRLNGSTRIGYTFSYDWKIDLHYDFSDQNDTGVPGPLSKQKYEVANPSERDFFRQGVSVDLTGKVQDHQVSTKFYYNDLDSFSLYSMDSYSSSYRGRNYDKKIRERGVQLQDFWSIAEQNDLVFGFDYGHQKEENVAKNGDGSTRTYYMPDYSREKYGFFAESINRFQGEKFVVNVGGRFDEISTTVNASTYEGTSYRYAGGTEDFNRFSPRGGIVWKFNPTWRLHSSVGTAFIAPDSREIAGYYESEYSSYIKVSRGNADLDPESSVTWDVGLGSSNGFMTLDLTYFKTEVEDRIVSINTGETEPAGEDGKERRIYTYVNADSQEMNGVEITGVLSIDSLLGQIKGELDFSVNVTWMDEAEVITGSTVEPVKNIADWKGNLALNYTIENFSTQFNARYNGNRFDKDYTYDDYYGGDWYEFPSYWVFDWSFSYAFTQKQKVVLYLENIFDTYYYEKLDYPQEGRNASLRYIYSF